MYGDPGYIPLTIVDVGLDFKATCRCCMCFRSYWSQLLHVIIPKIKLTCPMLKKSQAVWYWPKVLKCNKGVLYYRMSAQRRLMCQCLLTCKTAIAGRICDMLICVKDIKCALSAYVTALVDDVSTAIFYNVVSSASCSYIFHLNNNFVCL